MISKNVSLKKYNTFNLDYKASKLITIFSEAEIAEHISTESKILVLGGGSNFLFTGDFNGTIIHPLIYGISVEEISGSKVTVSAGSGVNWDQFVEWCIENGFFGLENLSYIPGNVGAAPVQNIGAYGSEVREFISKVRTISMETGEVMEFTNAECRFGYRNSVFKNEFKRKFIVTKVYFSLSTDYNPLAGYGRVIEEAAKYGEITPKSIRKTVIDIRKNRLPDPKILGNAGSFFKNPVISASLSKDLLGLYGDMPNFEEPDGRIKLSAAWLIDQCGWKGKRIGDAGVHDKQPLVIVNHGKASGMEIFNLSKKIQLSVKERFNVDLEYEVEVVTN